MSFVSGGLRTINARILSSADIWIRNENLRRGSCSTTESRKSCGVIYSCPSNSAEANLMNRRSRDVNLTDFSDSSWKREEGIFIDYIWREAARVKVKGSESPNTNNKNSRER